MTADEIKAARLRAGMTQLELAVAVGATPASVSRWENGHAKPSLKKERAMTNLFGGQRQ